MNIDTVRNIADAVLYEGYMLYPYRPSSVKNRQRWTFGGLYPEPYVAHAGNASSFQAQFLVETSGDPEIALTVRFLHLLRRKAGCEQDDVEEGIPRDVGIGEFEFPGDVRQRPIRGSVELSRERLPNGLERITIRVRNLSTLDDPLAVLASTHAIAHVTNGSFISLTDPPESYREAASECVNTGVWPVLAGAPGSSEFMLISPIILYDYPQIAPESAGDLFDATEIDEILSLRILTLTDAEKDEIRAGDPRTRRVLERTELLSDRDLLKLHGVLRNPRALETPRQLKRGDRVRLWPRKNADILDIALRGQIAEIESVEVDYDDRVHFAVVLEDDPGKDLGVLRQPGHRFFFSPDEVEPVS